MKRKADWMGGNPIERNVRQQLAHEIAEHKPNGPLTNRDVLIANDGSATKKIGTSSRLSSMAHLAPFGGLDPSTKEINSMALLNPRAGQINRPKGATRVQVSDDGEMSYGASANDKLAFAMNAMPVADNFTFTWKCLGLHQILFVHRPNRESLQHQGRPETINDAKFCSVSMLNAIFAAGGERDSKQRYVASSKHDMLYDWSLYGSVQAVEPISDGRLRNYPLVTFVKKGVAKVINYWAACTPQVVDAAHVWFVFVRRPKNPKLAGWYADLVNFIRDVHCGGSKTKESRESVRKASDLLADWDLQNADNANDTATNCVWRWEPHVEHSSRHPPTYIWQGVNWTGDHKRVGRVIQGASGLQPPAAYTTTVKEIMYPDIDHLDRYESAVSAENGPKRGVPPILVDMDWGT